MQKSLVVLAIFAAVAFAGHLKIPTTYICESKVIAVVSGSSYTLTSHIVSNGDEIYQQSTFEYGGQKSDSKMWLFKGALTRYDTDSYSVGSCRSQKITQEQFEKYDMFGSINAKAKGPGQRCLSPSLKSGHIWTMVENTTTVDICVSKDETTPYYMRMKDSARPSDPVAVFQLNFTKTAPSASELTLPSSCSAPITSTGSSPIWTSSAIFTTSPDVTRTLSPSTAAPTAVVTQSQAIPNVNIPSTYFLKYVSQSPSWTEYGNVTRQKNGDSAVQTVDAYYSKYYVNATGGLYTMHEKFDHNCTKFNQTVGYNFDDDLSYALYFNFKWNFVSSCGPNNSGFQYKQEYSQSQLCTDSTATQPIWLHTSYKNITYTEFRIENLPAFNLPKECSQ